MLQTLHMVCELDDIKFNKVGVVTKTFMPTLLGQVISSDHTDGCGNASKQGQLSF